MAESGDRFRREDLARHDARKEEVGGGGHPEGAAAWQAEDLGRAEAPEPEHRTGMGGHAAADHHAARAPRARRRTARAGRRRTRRRPAARRPAVRWPVRCSAPRAAASATAASSWLTSRSPRKLPPSASARSRDAASKRPRAPSSSGSATMPATVSPAYGRTSTSGASSFASRTPCMTVSRSTTWGAALTLATSSPASTGWWAQRVKISSGSIALTRASPSRASVSTPRWRGAQVHPPLARDADA